MKIYSETITYNSSLRAAPASVTLKHARRLGARLGITRVTDITRLDRVGIPVFVSIRPNARPGSLCVNAGKGVTQEEAQVGAWMEAIEYALAEPGVSSVECVEASARQILDGHTRAEAILDFGPRMGMQIPLEAPMQCVAAEEILSGSTCLVPAELVFLPFPSIGPHWFGSSSCGLASGNTLLEATVHALSEALEHDITSFHYLNDTSIPLCPESFSPPASDLVNAIRATGLKLSVCYLPNVFGLPCFKATIHDPDTESLRLFNGGYGCHPCRSIALTRALCEAAQSRLSFIHGGRDDLPAWETLTDDNACKGRHRNSIRHTQTPMNLAEVPDFEPKVRTLEACFAVLVRCLNIAGLNRVCRVVFTDRGDELQIIRILVPGLEEFDGFSDRVGRRLSHYAASL